MKRSQIRQSSVCVRWQLHTDHVRSGVQETTNSVTALLKFKSSSWQPHAVLEVWLLSIGMHISIMCCSLCPEKLRLYHQLLTIKHTKRPQIKKSIKTEIPGNFHLVPWLKLSPSFSLPVLLFFYLKGKIHRQLRQGKEEQGRQNSK